MILFVLKLKQPYSRVLLHFVIISIKISKLRPCSWLKVCFHQRTDATDLDLLKAIQVIKTGKTKMFIDYMI